MNLTRARITRMAVVVILFAGIAGVARPALGFNPILFADSSPTASFDITKLTAPRSVNAGGMIAGSVTVSSAVPAPRTVALTSSNPQVVSVQSTVVIPPGSAQSIPFQVRGVSAGCATIVARQGDSSRSHFVLVHPAPTGAAFSLNVPETNIPAAGSGIAARATVTNAGSPLPAVVKLSSSDSIAVNVPSTAAIIRGQASFNIMARNTGCVTITATIGSQSAKKTVQSVHIGG